MGIVCNELAIQELMAQGNDEQTIRLVNFLLSTVPAQSEERVYKLLQLGQRYMVLAFLKEDGIIAPTVEAHLVRRFEQRKNHRHTSEEPQDRIASQWYAKAGRLFSHALEQAQSSQTKGNAAMYRGFVYAAFGAYALALADIDLALSFVPSSPEFTSWRELISTQQIAQDLALVALNVPCEHPSVYHRNAQPA